MTKNSNYKKEKNIVEQVYKLILKENNERILEEDEVLEEILDYLSNISRRLDLVQIKLNKVLDTDKMRF